MSVYNQAFHISCIAALALLGVCGCFMFFKILLHLAAFLPSRKFPRARASHKYGIVIPARNESKIIRQILDSIQGQTYNSDLIHTYLIVESEDDPTCTIAKSYKNTHIFVRQHLDQKGKGHALDELFTDLLEKGFEHEAFFIFDADNILYPNYIEEMNKVYDRGYDVGLGYRNTKNWNDNWISSCSGLTFLGFNAFGSRPKSKLGLTVNICGTGFYISAKVIRKAGGYKFFTLTEDIEFKLYTALNNISSTYNENAKFLDEQPNTLKTSWNQRLRWCKGFGAAHKIYTPKLLKSCPKEKENRLNKFQQALDVVPIVVCLVSVIIYQLFNFSLMLAGIVQNEGTWYQPAICWGSAVLGLHVFLSLYTLVLIRMERKNINLRPGRALIAVMMNPIFMLMFLPIYVVSMFKRDVKWVAIKHTAEMKVCDIPQEIKIQTGLADPLLPEVPNADGIFVYR